MSKAVIGKKRDDRWFRGDKQARKERGREGEDKDLHGKTSNKSHVFLRGNLGKRGAVLAQLRDLAQSRLWL